VVGFRTGEHHIEVAGRIEAADRTGAADRTEVVAHSQEIVVDKQD